mmetsp:Transcript_45000/g.77584  ORF Transcript_45000/g.77584 Transcript_45000/m.77584 type:complete len:85 (-) Transcript_45000:371-625(-)
MVGHKKPSVLVIKMAYDGLSHLTPALQMNPPPMGLLILKRLPAMMRIQLHHQDETFCYCFCLFPCSFFIIITPSLITTILVQQQ